MYSRGIKMIKPYTTQNKITKENSMFNSLPYMCSNLEHWIHIYDTQIILNMELPLKEPYTENLTEAILKIQNEQYYAEYIKFKPRKTIKDVFKYLYEN